MADASRLACVVRAALVACVGAACAPADTGLAAWPALATLPSGRWSTVPGGAGTSCGVTAEFHFFVRPADPARLLVLFDGGGWCADAASCDVNGDPTFAWRMDAPTHRDRAAGVLDFADPRNPFRDYTVIFVPYCTGDVHLGDRVVTYTVPATAAKPARSFDMHYAGLANGSAVLRWSFDHMRDPATVFVTGVSAGAIPTPYYAARMARRWPAARVVQLGDGAGAYRTAAIPHRLAVWGTQAALRSDTVFARADAARFTFAWLYAAAAVSAPRLSLAQVTTDSDAGQLAVLDAMGAHADRLAPLLAAEFAEIRAAAPGFRVFVAPGGEHTVLTRDAFYAVSVDGTSVREWVAALAEGRRVDDVGTRRLGAP